MAQGCAFCSVELLPMSICSPAFGLYRGGQRFFLPLAVVIAVVWQAVFLVDCGSCRRGLVCGLPCRLRRLRMWFGKRFFLSIAAVADGVWSAASLAACGGCGCGLVGKPPVMVTRTGGLTCRNCPTGPTASAFLSAARHGTAGANARLQIWERRHAAVGGKRGRFSWLLAPNHRQGAVRPAP